MTQRRSGRAGDGIIERNGVFSFRIYLPGGGRDWYGGFPSHAEAKKAKDVAEGEKHKHTGRSRETCASFADRWLEDYNVRDGKERWSEETVRAYRGDLKRFREDWGPVRLDKLPSSEKFDLWQQRQPRGAMTVLGACLEDARKARLISENPLAGRKAPAGKGRRQIEAITEEELYVLGECAYEEWETRAPGYGLSAQAYVIWQGTVGTRPIAVRHLRPEHVDLANASVYLAHPGKKVAPRTVFIPPRTVELLKVLPRRLNAEWYFTTQRGRRLNTPNEYNFWQPVRTRFEAELPPDRARELRDSRRTGGPIELYELRHCAATTMRRRGADWEDIAYQLCHTDKGEQARQTYSHLTEADHMTALRRVWGGNVADLSEAREASSG